MFFCFVHFLENDWSLNYDILLSDDLFICFCFYLGFIYVLFYF